MSRKQETTKSKYKKRKSTKKEREGFYKNFNYVGVAQVSREKDSKEKAIFFFFFHYKITLDRVCTLLSKQNVRFPVTPSRREQETRTHRESSERNTVHRGERRRRDKKKMKEKRKEGRQLRKKKRKKRRECTRKGKKEKRRKKEKINGK